MTRSPVVNCPAPNAGWATVKRPRKPARPAAPNRSGYARRLACMSLLRSADGLPQPLPCLYQPRTDRRRFEGRISSAGRVGVTQGSTPFTIPTRSARTATRPRPRPAPGRRPLPEPVLPAEALERGSAQCPLVRICAQLAQPHQLAQAVGLECGPQVGELGRPDSDQQLIVL